MSVVLLFYFKYLKFEIEEKFAFSLVQFIRSVVSDSLWPHESQHARPPCPSPSPGVHSDSCPSSPWCHPAIPSSVVPFSWPQPLPASESFPMSQLFAWGGQSIGVTASTAVLPMNTQDWSPLGWTGWVSLQSKGLSRVFSNTTVQKRQFFGSSLGSSKTPVGSAVMDSMEVEGLGPDELLLLLLLLSNRAEDCSGWVSRAARPSGKELSSPLSLFLVPWPPIPGISAAGPDTRWASVLLGAGLGVVTWGLLGHKASWGWARAGLGRGRGVENIF